MFAGTCPVSIDLFIMMLIGRHGAGCSDFNSFELMPSWPELFLYFNDAMMRDIYSGSVGDINVYRWQFGLCYK